MSKIFVCGTHGSDGKHVHNVQVRKAWKTETALKNTPRLQDNIKIYSHETGWEDMDWIYLATIRDQRWALVNTVTK